MLAFWRNEIFALASFTEHVFEVHLRCSTYQYFIPLMAKQPSYSFFLIYSWVVSILQTRFQKVPHYQTTSFPSHPSPRRSFQKSQLCKLAETPALSPLRPWPHLFPILPSTMAMKFLVGSFLSDSLGLGVLFPSGVRGAVPYAEEALRTCLLSGIQS